MGKLWKMERSPWLSVLLGGLSALVTAQGAIAQDKNLPVCQSPDADEFLVLVFTPSQPLREEVRLQVGRTLSKDHDLVVCQYGGNVLSRIGNFESQARATQWAEYFDGPTGTWVGQQSRTYQTWTIVGFLLMHHFLHVNPDDVLMLNLDESMGH